MGFISLGIGVVLALVGIGLTWYSIRSKSPCYAISGTSLASPSSIGKYGDLEIRFSGRKVKQVTVTHICLWNSGRDTIRQGDIAPADPIRVTLNPGYEILSCKVTGCSRPVVAAKTYSIEPDDPFETPNMVTFDFLDYQDWVVIQVLHTADKPDDCSLAGTVMGSRSGLRRATTTDGIGLYTGGALLATASMSIIAMSTVLGLETWIGALVAGAVIVIALGLSAPKLLNRVPKGPLKAMGL